MKFENKTIAIRNLRLNNGQIAGVGKNPRKIKDKEIKRLEKSIRDFPDMLHLRELVVFPLNGVFVTLGGNQRLKAAKAAGLESLPCKVLSEDTPVEVLREFVIKDNQQVGEDDWEVLSQEWDIAEVKEWVNSESIPNQFRINSESIPNDVVPNVTESICQRGDLWRLGNHRLYCGDSCSSVDFEHLMNKEKATMVFTDPPYGVSIGSKNKNVLNTGIKVDIFNDNVEINELTDKLTDFVVNMKANCSEDAVYFITVPSIYAMQFLQMFDRGDLPIRHILIWAKNRPTFSMSRLDYDYQSEFIFYTWAKKHHNYRLGVKRTSLWDFDVLQKCDLHPTMKPIDLIRNAILDGSQEGDVVLDCFGGSGSTLIAAELLKRNAYLMELDPHYCDIIIKRWEEMTGGKAELLNHYE